MDLIHNIKLPGFVNKMEEMKGRPLRL